MEPGNAHGVNFRSFAILANLIKEISEDGLADIGAYHGLCSFAGPARSCL